LAFVGPGWAIPLGIFIAHVDTRIAVFGVDQAVAQQEGWRRRALVPLAVVGIATAFWFGDGNETVADARVKLHASWTLLG